MRISLFREDGSLQLTTIIDSQRLRTVNTLPFVALRGNDFDLNYMPLGGRIEIESDWPAVSRYNVTVNLNDTARVRLRSRGLEIIQSERSRLAIEIPHLDWSTWREPDADGCLSMPLWEIMSLFGAACFIGPESPFETTFTVSRS